MKHIIGYWHWEPGTRTMHRSDGATVRFVGADPNRPTTGAMLWMAFEIVTGCERLQVPVQQRLVGRKSNFRSLWYRADLRDSKLRPERWAAVERLIADALACWPRRDLIDGLPTGVGIAGGYLNGIFHSDMVRLYLPDYVGKPLFEGEISPNSESRVWRAQPRPQGSEALGTVTCDDATLTLRSAVDEKLSRLNIFQLYYEDAEFRSDRMVIATGNPVTSYYSAFEDKPTTEKLRLPPGGFMDRWFERSRRKRTKSNGLLPMPEFENYYAALHTGLFALSRATIPSGKLTLPPTVVQSKSPWLRAGYLDQLCVTGLELVLPDLQAAFADHPDPATVLNSPLGSAFDPATGTLHAPDGSSLAIERVDDTLGVTPTRMTFRCRAAGLDWPIIVRRVDRPPSGSSEYSYRPEMMSRWQIDHDESLAEWRKEGHSGLPDRDAWERLRQFLEEAILSWGDRPKAGPAPQSLATSGGWYDGQWRGDELRRLMSRPNAEHHIDRTDNWMPYLSVASWKRTDNTPADRPDPSTGGYIEPVKTPVWFEKVAIGGPAATLSASGYIAQQYRDEERVRITADYHDSGNNIRLGGGRRHLATGGIVRIGESSPTEEQLTKVDTPKRSAVEQPDLQLWRRLRDAAESGLRPGEAVTVIGGYFFGLFDARTLRTTAFATEPTDFDTHLWGEGDAFVRF